MNNASLIGIGVDVGGSHIACGGVDLATGELVAGTHFEADLDNKATKELVFEQWARPINQCLEKIGDAAIDGIGFGMPGAFNYRDGIALYSGNDKYENLYGVSVVDELPAYLSKKNISLRFINDATAFAVGTSWFGAAKGTSKAICMTLGTGFGSAFIHNGAPVAHGTGVPANGCLWDAPFQSGIADEYFSTRWFVNEFELRLGERVAGVKEMVAHPRQGVVEGVFKTFAENLVQFMAPWITGFQPEVIVIGGNISRAWNRIEPWLGKAFEHRGIHIRCLVSDQLEEAAIAGSARLLNDDFWTQIKDDLPSQ
ncbi:ROK family protein [Marinoscillum furvescens]|uniref:Glucokinase n=1 Tax=Marinoscillum furvescens DSM 4134 TaxID=1122208 RepID=A0A3D9KZ57_MARFU|nr:ROK family protein [Marinoscillum furvescens]RED94957.1 glucokinase [Marinoscillum furvescens DSM 4134]